MIVEEKTREELINEILELQKRISELERSDTECRRAQEALRKEWDKAQNYLDVAGVMFVVIDADETVTLTNKKGCDILGCEQEEIVGKNWFDSFVPERIREETRMVFMALMAGEIEPVEYHENPVLAKNDEERIIAFHNTILRDETGKATATLSSGEDITEYRRAEDALRESENKFRDLAERSVVGIYIVQDGAFKYVNPKMAEIFGYEVQEIVEQKSIKDLVFPEDLPTVEENIRKRISGEVESIHYECRAITKDGQVIYVEVYGSRTMHQGRPAVVGSLLDITERKLAEQALYLSEEKYRTMIEHCNDMIWTLDIDGNVTFLNKRCEEVSGYQFTDFRGEAFIPLVVEEYLPWTTEAFRRTLEGQPQHYEMGIRKRDGDTLIVSVNSAPIFINGEVVGTVNFARDVTMQKRTEEELKLKAELLDATTDSIMLHDLEGNLIYCNETSYKSRGYDKYEFMKINLHDLDTPEHAALIESRIRALVESGEAVFESANFRKDGSVMPIEVHARTIESEGRKLILSATHDITQRKLAEEALKESEDKFRDLAEKSIVGFYLIQDGVFKYVNPRLAQIFGYKAEEIIDKMEVKDLVFPEDWPIVEENIRKRVCGEIDSINYDFRGLTKNQEAIYVEVYGSRTLYKGKPAVIGTLLDITERKKVAEATAESEEKYRTMVEQSNDMIWTLDREGNFAFFNKRSEEISGYRLKDWLGKTFVPLIVEEDLPRVTEVFNKTLEGEAQHYEVRIRKEDGNILFLSVNTAPIFRGCEVVGTVSFGRDITELRRAEEDRQDTLKKLREALRGIIQVVALTVESKDPYTAGHQKRVADLARAIAQDMGLPKDQVDAIRIAGVIHDIGKVSVPTEILSKPGKITEIEMAMIKTHPKIGYEILKDIEFPWPIAQIILQHHERMDGSGYPLGISDEDILLEARILGVADVVEAMASHRPYRPALGTNDAIEEITRNRGILYDADVVDVCVRLLAEKGFEFEEAKEALVT